MKDKRFEDVMHNYTLDAESKVEYLTTADSDIEADAIISLLDYNGIQGLKKPIGAGSYLSIAQGFNTQGTKLFVLESDFELAMTLIAEENMTNEPLDDEFVDDEIDYKETRKNKTRLALAIFFFGPAMIVGLLMLLNKL